MTAWLTVERRALIAAALFAGWVASLALPAVKLGGLLPDPINGAAVLGFGWMGVPHLQFAWMANPLLAIVLGLLLLPRPRARTLRIVAALLALCLVQAIDLAVRPDIHGTSSVHSGYFLWLGVCLAAAAIAVLYSFQTITERHDQPV